MTRDAALGCAACTAEDAAAAWEAMHATRLRHMIEESHFSVRVTGCACGQRFAVVFTERIDWRDGEDDQLWLAAPVTSAELSVLEAADHVSLPGELTRIVAGRRFVVRSFPTGSALGCWWRDSGFAIGPHD